MNSVTINNLNGDFQVTATKSEISEWFDQAKLTKHDYLIVACDTFDGEDYPIPCSAADFWSLYASHNRPNTQKIMEVYDLSLDKESQIQEFRAFHIPSDEEL